MKKISIRERAGVFAENKDVAKDIRVGEILPALQKSEEITLDFSGVEATTQSFIHALISDPLRKFGNKALDLMLFKSCSETIRKIITIVVEYTQESMGAPD